MTPKEPARDRDRRSSSVRPAGPQRGGSRRPLRDEPEETRWERTKANVKTIGGAVALAIVIRIGFFEAFEIEGPSMEPTLLNGDRVVVAKFSYGLFLPFASSATFTWSGPEPGDVVIVKSPHDEVDIVKRVIGVAGDTIELRDDVVWRNGRELPSEDLGPCVEIEPHLRGETSECVSERVDGYTYRTSRDLTSAPANHPPLEVPAGHVYLLGDHRDRSNDSRFFGTVPIDRVKGRALAIYWSSDEGSGRRWDRFFDGVR